jgi:hypothetical protein
MFDRLEDLKNHPDENLVPYEEFELLDGETYYFTPGGFLYRKDPGPKRWEVSSAATSPTRSGTTGPTTASGSLYQLASSIRKRAGLYSLGPLS